jgi:hypothetical protein
MSSTIEDTARHWDRTATGGSKDLHARTKSYARRFADAIAMIEVTPEALIRLGRTIESWLPKSILRLIALRRMLLCVCEPSPSD